MINFKKRYFARSICQFICVIKKLKNNQLFFPARCKKELTTDNTKENANAHKNPSTKKPATIRDASIIKKAFIIKVNNPNVKMVIGKVRITKIGRIKAFSIPIIKAAIKADIKPETSTPGNI